MHWRWKNCPAAWHGMYKGKEGAPSIILEGVADYRLYIWHAFFGMPGTCNDINVVDNSPLSRITAAGEFPPTMHHVINESVYSKGYLLTDGIYPEYAYFVKTINQPVTPKQKKFAKYQEAACKDVERAFGVLQAMFQIVSMPSRFWYSTSMQLIMKTCIILHNMCVEDNEKNGVYDNIFSYARQDGTNLNTVLENGETEEVFEYNSTWNPLDLNEALYFTRIGKNVEAMIDKEKHRKLKNDLIEHIWKVMK